MLNHKLKIIAILLLACMIGATAVPAAASVVREAGEQARVILGFLPACEKQQPAPNERINPIEPVVLKTEVTGAEGDNEQILYQGSRDSLEENPQDHYSLTSEQMEQYLQDGFTVSDLYEADARANKLFIPPEQLLEIKKTEGDWEQVEKTAKQNAALEIVERVYKDKYPAAYEEMSKYQLEPEAQLQLFAYYNHDKSTSMKELIDRYQQSPEVFKQDQAKLTDKSATWSIRANKANLSSPSKEQKSEIASSETVLKERDQQLIEELAEKTGQSVDKLAEQYQSFVKGAW